MKRGMRRDHGIGHAKFVKDVNKQSMHTSAFKSDAAVICEIPLLGWKIVVALPYLQGDAICGTY